MSVTETTDVDRKVLWVEVTTIIVSFCEVVHEGVVRKLSVETVTFLKIVEIYWIGPVGVEAVEGISPVEVTEGRIRDNAIASRKAILNMRATSSLRVLGSSSDNVLNPI